MSDQPDSQVEDSPAPASASTAAKAQARQLPIWERADELKQLITDNQVVVVAGETGSGKSTQLPQLCLELGLAANGRIGHTQPRRIAARTVAERIAEELGTSLGDRVGYAIRFDDRVKESTEIKVMTDGILLAEIQRDRMLSAYSVLLIDEAHERSLNIDFLLGYLKQLLPKRPDLKLIITSATIDTTRFSEHFDDAPIVEVSGRTYPVDVQYRPFEDSTLPDAIVDAVKELWRTTDGDVLVFCSGERDIRDATDALEAAKLANADVFPLYARLSSAEQQRVFRSHPKRRVVLATNVAETSLTVPGIRSVIDPGLARISRYSARTKVQRLPIEKVSQASANQRAGRCGRVAPGVCIRLYAEDDFDARPEFTEPEITRTNLASVILSMASLGLGDIEAFPFVEPPDKRNIADGIAVLEELNAVDPDRFGTKKWLTSMGRELARLPVDPRLARMIIASGDEGCVDEVLIIAAALSVQDVRERPMENREAAQQLHARFADDRSDFFAMLNLWRFLETERAERSGNQFRRMCRSEFLHYMRIREWQDVHRQLRRVAKQLRLETSNRPIEIDKVPQEAVHRALLSGFLSQVGTKKTDDAPKKGAKKQGKGKGRPPRATYVGPRNMDFILAPGSGVAKTAPKWVMAAELVETDQLRARTVAAVDPRWLESIGSHLMRWNYTGAQWDPEQGAAFVIERATMLGLPVVAGRRILLDRVNPELAREMLIQNALVDPMWPDEVTVNVERFRALDVIQGNDAMIEQANGIEARARRTDLVAGHDAIFDFYNERLPEDITSLKRFNSWWRRHRDEAPDAIALTMQHLLPGHDELDLAGFPDQWSIGGWDLDLHYEFDATSPIDGVTIDVPVAALADLDAAPFTWTVPGLRPGLFDGLLRALPKLVRKEFIPIAETSKRLAAELVPDDLPVVDAIAEHLALRSGIETSMITIDQTSIPGHLRPTFRVLGTDGEMLAAGKDLARLQARLDARARSSLRTERHPLEVDGLIDWPELPDGALPESVQRVDGGHSIVAFPALVDERREGTGTAVAVRLLASEAEQRSADWFGARRLLELGLTINQRGITDRLSNHDRLTLAVGAYESIEAWVDDIITTALDEVLRSAGGPPRTAARFRALDAWAVRQLPELLPTVTDLAIGMLRRVATIEGALQDEWSQGAAAAVADIGEQLERLHGPGSLMTAGFQRLEHVDRYLEGIEVRMERLQADARRDRQLMVDIAALAGEIAAAPVRSRAELTWQLEELRVSVFAQNLGTDGPVSVKRIRRAIAQA